MRNAYRFPSFWQLESFALLALGFGLGMLNAHGNGAVAHAQQAPPQQNTYRGGVYQPGGYTAASGPENVMIVLDSSYSMGEPIGGSREDKMVAAKRTVLEVLRSISPSTRVGLRVYGNSANQFTACRATSLMVPLGENNRNLIASKMIGLRPTGATPISYTVMRSLQEDFNAVNGQNSIILISDGIETCGEDPCDVAVRMQQMGVHVKINVIGLGLQDYAAVKQLRCVALATKGQFYTANTAAELANSLNKALAVETNVQGTILQNPQNNAPAPAQTRMPTVPVLQAEEPAKKSGLKPYKELELPAAVPMESRKR